MNIPTTVGCSAIYQFHMRVDAHVGTTPIPFLGDLTPLKEFPLSLLFRQPRSGINSHIISSVVLLNKAEAVGQKLSVNRLFKRDSSARLNSCWSRSACPCSYGSFPAIPSAFSRRPIIRLSKQEERSSFISPTSFLKGEPKTLLPTSKSPVG